MPRLTKATKPSRGASKKAFNAAGYAKRKSLKSKTLSNASDVYEYQGERVRRAKVKLLLEKDEMIGGGNDDSDAEGSISGRPRPRLVGENDDDEGIDEDDDEEIDSDAAFDESDEEQFAGFSFSRNKVCPKYVRCCNVTHIHQRDPNPLRRLNHRRTLGRRPSALLK